MARPYVNPQRLAPLTDPSYNAYLIPLLLLFEAAFLSLIILKIPYTEIDWTTYMVQVRKFLVDGERNYAKITGPTGPCVYPATFLYLYSALYAVTSEGQDIRTAQWIFAGLYLGVLAMVMGCYWKVGAPPWLMVLLIGSKRLHSVFVLRLFNDCWAVAAFWGCVWLLQRRKWEGAALVWGLGVGVKMVLLLAAPALAFVLVQGGGLFVGLFGGTSAVMLQVMTAVPFLDPKIGDAGMYFTRAFEFSRQFLYTWTVNWRFVAEETFLSRGFQVGLLILHISILVAFIHTRWVGPSRLSNLRHFLRKFAIQEKGAVDDDVSARVTPTFVMDSMLVSMAVGLLCARSLHYQFYAYLGWATPYLLWRSGGGPVWVLVNWAAQEYAWLIFPQTEIGSMIVVFELAVQVMSGLIAPPVDHIRPPVHVVGKQKPKVR